MQEDNHKIKKDERNNEVMSIAPDLSPNKVINWIDNFSTNLSKLGDVSSSLGEESMSLVHKLEEESDKIRVFFNEVNSTFRWILIPKKKKNKLFAFMSKDKSEYEVQYTPQLIEDIKLNVKKLIEDYDKYKEYGKVNFIRSELDNLINKLYIAIEDTKYAQAASNYLSSKDENMYFNHSNRIQLLNQSFQYHLISYKGTLDNFDSELDKYETIKEFIIPLLFLNLQNLISKRRVQESVDTIIEKLKLI